LSRREGKTIRKDSISSLSRQVGRESDAASTSSVVSLGSLYKVAENKLQLALEYWSWPRRTQRRFRTIFHTRMLKIHLVQYVVEECLTCEMCTASARHCHESRNTGQSGLLYLRSGKAKGKVALERSERKEGKRKAYEAA
jgi:hypothetical protein